MRYKVIKDFDILGELFLKGEELYISESRYVMNGVIDYGRDVYKNGERIGMIRDSKFWNSIQYNVTSAEEVERKEEKSKDALRKAYEAGAKSVEIGLSFDRWYYDYIMQS